jgi:G3E family GTPase
MIPKKTYLITGFLGAGKTSFINQFLKHTSYKTCIIENEFGAISIDRLFLEQNTFQQIYEINDGCLCCSSHQEFFKVLQLFHNNPAEQLLIETSGIAQSGNLAFLFYNNAALQQAYRLLEIIVIVDAQNVLDQINQHPEIAHQIAHSSLVLINKTQDLVFEKIQKIQNLIKSLNPTALQFIRIPKLLEHIKNTVYISALTSQNIEIKNTVSHIQNYSNCMLEFESPFNISTLKLVLTRFIKFQSENTFRIKGVILDEQNKSYFLNTVYKDFQLKEIFFKENEKVSKVVIIGKNICPNSYKKLFEKALYRVIKSI